MRENKSPIQTMNIVPGNVVKQILEKSCKEVVNIVKDTYAAHERGETINPDSYFLRYPNQTTDRIIALPASIQTEQYNLSGIKWIASFPNNILNGLPRASAVLILNRNSNGYPYAILESAMISSARTAASAVLATNVILGQDGRRTIESIGVIGSGIIARTILDQLAEHGWAGNEINIHDINPSSAEGLKSRVELNGNFKMTKTTSLLEAMESELVIFATSAGTPYTPETFRFTGKQLILNISLRDIHPNQIIEAQNLFDDVDHCMKANTSPHLAEKQAGNRCFATGTINQLIQGTIEINSKEATIYSPFGMGILDLAVGQYVYEYAMREGLAIEIPNFFGDTERWT